MLLKRQSIRGVAIITGVMLRGDMYDDTLTDAPISLDIEEEQLHFEVAVGFHPGGDG